MSDGTGRLYKRGTTWWIDYSFRGQRYRESSGSTRKGDAKLLLRNRTAEMGKGRLLGPNEERITLNDLLQAVIDDYEVRRLRSTKRLRTSCGHLTEVLGPTLPALDLDADRLRKYVIHRRRSGASDSSIQKELAALKRGMRLCAGFNSVPEFPRVEPDNVRQDFFTDAEVRRVVEELPPPLRPVVMFAYYTGWRKSEVLGLEWSKILWDSGTIRLEPGTTKNGEGREFSFHNFPALKELLIAQHRLTAGVQRQRGMIVSRVFHRDGKPIQDMRTAWDAACRRAGLQGRWFHDLRRSAVRNLERARVSRSTAMKLTGHKTESVYTRYAITDQDALEEGVGRLAKLHGSSPPRSTPAAFG